MKKILKKILPADSAFYKFLSKKYRSLFKLWLPAARQAEDILQQYSAVASDVFFIQVGSNDGVANDPLRQYVLNCKWSGILVEPVKYLFDKLKLNYAGNANQLYFENAAIAETDGTAKFYRLKEMSDAATPPWYSQIGSFNRQVLLSHKDREDFESLILEEDINTISFASLIKKYDVKNTSLIHIDTEGYDFNILQLIDFSSLKPDIVMYEYVHLSLGDFVRSLKLMRASGYQLYSSNLDIVCVSKKLTTINA